jgi:hypothetical protein
MSSSGMTLIPVAMHARVRSGLIPIDSGYRLRQSSSMSTAIAEAARQ